MKRLIEATKRVKTSFNSYFFVWIVVLFLLLLEAYMYNDNRVYILVFLLFSLGSMNEIFARINLYKIEVLFLPKERLFAETEGYLTYAVMNFAKSSSYGIELNNQKINVIKTNEKKMIKTPFIPLKRGFLKLEESQIQSSFPLPHITAKKNFKSYGGITIYPKPEGISLEKKFGVNTLKSGGSGEFDGIRAHIEGEPLSHIHWASYAKQEKWMSKEFLEETPEIELSLNYGTLQGSHEERLSQLCLWILECEKNEIDFSLILLGTNYHSKDDGIDTLLEKLAYA